jgi:RNase P/RNase MRP subunit p29
MEINPKYLIYHDLIGLETFAKAKSKKKKVSSFSYIGNVIDDTENMLITKNDTTIKKYIKKEYMFRFQLPTKNNGTHDLLEVDGSKIVGSPENRLRKLKRKKRF